MSSRPTVYHGGLDFIAYSDYWHTPFKSRYYSVVDANRFFTVPKDALKDRGCCVEASSSLAYQLAVGKVLKGRYQKRFGVDLRYGKEVHMTLARHASVSGSHATIDLSNASDTICYNVVKLILPEDWFNLLNSLRAPYTQLDDKKVRLEKFTSMGNGFTFELETIIFRTLCDTVVDYSGETWCFGDDIIVPTANAEDVLSALRFFGFTPNEGKTFTKGNFRESCGGDYFKGVDVRPYHLEELPDEPRKWVSLANGLRRWDPYLTKIRATWRCVVDQIPRDWRLYGPLDLGDTVLYDPDAKPEVRTFKYEGVPVTALSWRLRRPVNESFTLTDRWDPNTALNAAVYGVPPQVTRRDPVILSWKTETVIAYGVDWLPI
jgi:hypothetical protein